MIKAFAGRIALTMGAQLRVDRDTVEIFSYGLEIILGMLVQLAVTLFLSLLMGTFKTTMVCLVAYSSLRYFGGGAHLSTQLGCLAVGVYLFLGLGQLATLDVSLEALTVVAALALPVGFYTIFRWVPAGTEKKHIKDKSIRLRQKKKALFVLTVWSVAIAALIQQQQAIYAFAAVLGVLVSLFIITPWGYGANKALDHILSIILRGYKSCLKSCRR